MNLIRRRISIHESLPPTPLQRPVADSENPPSTSGSPVVTYDGIPRMPALFGRQVGPRQPSRAHPYAKSAGNTLVTWAVMSANPEKLAQHLPAGFSVRESVLIVEVITLSDLPWLAGRGYEMLLVTTPVTYAVGGSDHVGRLELVTWEDRPDAIISGRDELGWNKVYADTMDRRTANNGRSVRYTAAWGGTTFFELEAVLRRGTASLGTWRKGPLMHYRVLPSAGQWGDLEVEQVTAHPSNVPITALRQFRHADATFRFLPASFEQLPTHHHIVNRLADLTGDAACRFVEAGQARLSSWDDVRNIRVLSSKRSTAFGKPLHVIGGDGHA